MSEPNAPQKPPRAPVGTKGPQPCAIACTEDELAAYFKARGEPAFRATQVREFIYRKGIESWDGVTNLSKDWRTRLSQELPLYEMQPVSRKAALKHMIQANDAGACARQLVQSGVHGNVQLGSCCNSPNRWTRTVRAKALRGRHAAQSETMNFSFVEKFRRFCSAETISAGTIIRHH